VPPGVREIAVSYNYGKPQVPAGTLGNSCDIGIFDERGIAVGGEGFRGWSGGARTEFAIAADAATPGYLPGPVNPGTWHVALGPYTVAPRGLDYGVDVTLTLGAPGEPFVAEYPPQQVPGHGRAWYRGDCHLHTVYSDGCRLPEEVAAAARIAGLDFIVTTEHNTSASHGAWAQLAGHDLLIITGEEVTTRDGHCLAVGVPPGEWIDWRYRARDGAFAGFARQIRQSGGIVVPAHLCAPFIAGSWKFGYDDADAVEVWNGPWTPDDESALDIWDSMLVSSALGHGRWLPAVGNSDAHGEPQLIGLPHNVVHADALSRDALVVALAAGRTWIAESSTVNVDFAVTGSGHRAGIGERLDVDAETPVQVTLDVRGVPDGVVRILSDTGEVLRTSLPASGAGALGWQTTPSLAAYVRAEVRHTGGVMAALTNPIFLGRS
jgi:hypothetical protein